MYGCDHSLGCLSVSAWRADNGLKVTASRADSLTEEGIEVSAWRIGGGLKVTASRADSLTEEGIEVSAWRIGGGLKVTAGIICSVNKDAYLRVVPDVVWLSPDELAYGEFDIYSNVVWKID